MNLRRLVALVVLVAVLPLAALGWLGWKSVAQVRDLETQRLHDRLENSSNVIARHFASVFAGWEQTLDSSSGDPRGEAPPSTAGFVIGKDGVVKTSGVALPYYPAVASTPPASHALLRRAEEQEFRSSRDPRAASDAYRQAAALTHGNDRATALAGLARTLKLQGRSDEALGVYAELADMEQAAVGEWHAAIEARHQRRRIFEARRDERALEESRLISATLAQSRFLLDKATFDYYASGLRLPPAIPTDIALLAEAAAALWNTFGSQTTGRASFPESGATVTAVWKRTSSGIAVVLGRTELILASATPLAKDLRVTVEVEPDSERRIATTLAATSPSVVRLRHESGLPWTIRVTASDAATLQAQSRNRDWMLTGAFGVMVLVVGLAAYVVSRSLARELQVARLQSDFVAAVSHEFRSPLTAMRHMTEVLEDNEADEADLPQYYRALAKETRRLQGLVEGLLDFRQMEEGRHHYHLTRLDARALVAGVVEQISEGSLEKARLILAPGGDDTAVRADPDALGLALRNLLDNALKYSPSDTTVSITVSRRAEFVTITVGDSGPGIPLNEQRAVFRKFVRGAATKALNIKGTGLGLAMAEQIAKAHEGRLELTSDGKTGSAFAIVIPADGTPASPTEPLRTSQRPGEQHA